MAAGLTNQVTKKNPPIMDNNIDDKDQDALGRNQNLDVAKIIRNKNSIQIKQYSEVVEASKLSVEKENKDRKAAKSENSKQTVADSPPPAIVTKPETPSKDTKDKESTIKIEATQEQQAKIFESMAQIADETPGCKLRKEENPSNAEELSYIIAFEQRTAQEKFIRMLNTVLSEILNSPSEHQLTSILKGHSHDDNRDHAGSELKISVLGGNVLRFTLFQPGLELKNEHSSYTEKPEPALPMSSIFSNSQKLGLTYFGTPKEEEETIGYSDTLKNTAASRTVY